MAVSFTACIVGSEVVIEMVQRGGWVDSWCLWWVGGLPLEMLEMWGEVILLRIEVARMLVGQEHKA